MRRWLIAFAFLWSDYALAQPRPEDVEVSILAGGEVSLATEADVAVSPRVTVDVSLPLSSWEMTPRLYVGVGLTSLAGETLSLEDPATYRSVRVRLSVCQPIATSVYFDACLDGGFQSRLPTDPGPKDKAALWGAGGVRFGRTGKGWLLLTLGRDQRLDGLYQWAVGVSGAIRLYQRGPIALELVGDAILGAQYGPSAPRRDVVVVGMAAGVGR